MPGLFERFLRAALGPLMPQADPGEAGPPDPMETRSGVHLLHGMGAEHEFFSGTVDRSSVLAAIRSVDWDNEFSQVFAVVRPGVWLEVGGSLDPDHGLSASYVDRGKRIDSVIRTPPASVADMEAMMLRFLESEDSLLGTYDFS